MAVCTHGDLIVLPDWDTRPSAPWHDIPRLHYPNSAKHLTRNREVSIFISHWFDSNPWSPARETRSLLTRPSRSICIYIYTVKPLCLPWDRLLVIHLGRWPVYGDQKIRRCHSTGEDKPYIKSGESVGKWIENVSNYSKNLNISFTYHIIFTRNF